MKKMKAVLIWYLVGAMFVIGITPQCFAGFSPSEVIVLSPSDRSGDLQKLQNFLETKMVRERLKDLGFSSEEIRMKLSDLSDSQIHQLALHVDEIAVGGDGVGLFIVVLLVVALIVVIIYATGHKIVMK